MLAKKTITIKRVAEERAKKQEDKTWEAKSEKSAPILKEESTPFSEQTVDEVKEPKVFTYDFGAMLSLLKIGKKMARKCWKEGRYLKISTPTRESFIRAPFIYYHNPEGTNCVWTPQTIDLFATDWVEIVEVSNVG